MYHEIAWIFDQKYNDLDTALVFYELNMKTNPDNCTSSVYNVAHILRFTDPERAMSLLERTVHKDPDACWLMAFILQTRDPVRAIGYLEMGRPDPHCIYELGRKYAFGIGVDINQARGTALFREAAELGYERAILQLARYYRSGGGGLPVNEQLEVQWLEQVEKLPATDKYNLAFYYIRRQWNQDLQAKGFNMMMELVRDEQDANAMGTIADCYAQGKGVTKNADLAREWYIKACDAGDYDAALALAKDTHGLEHQHYLERAIELRSNPKWEFAHHKEYHDQQKLSVEVGTLKAWMKELQDGRARLAEYDLRPPLIGGAMFREARARFRHTGLLQKLL